MIKWDQFKQELIQPSVSPYKSVEIIRPILRGRDIKRYGYEFADLWLINTHNGIKEKGIDPININDYPAVKKYLNQFYDRLANRSDKGDSPYNLRNCAYMEDFSKQKIAWGNLNLMASYAIVPENYFVNAPCPMVVPASNYLLAILNSKVADYYIRNLGVTRNGGYFEYKPMFIEQLPIPIVQKTLQKKFDLLVKELSDLTGITAQNHFEREIDMLVYRIYGLTSDEIDFIETHLL